MICDLLDEIRPDPDLGRRRDLIRFVKDRPGHDLRYAMDFSKLETDVINYDLKLLIEDLLFSIKAQSRFKNIDFTIELESYMPNI